MDGWSWKVNLPIRPALVGRAGRNKHLSGKYGPIEKRLYPDAIGRESCFSQQCWKMEKHTNQSTPSMQMRGGQSVFINSLPIGWTIIKGTKPVGKKQDNGSVFRNQPKRMFWKDRRHLPKRESTGQSNLEGAGGFALLCDLLPTCFWSPCLLHWSMCDVDCNDHYWDRKQRGMRSISGQCQKALCEKWDFRKLEKNRPQRQMLEDAARHWKAQG